jgi:ankyrin repeat protein
MTAFGHVLVSSSFVTYIHEQKLAVCFASCCPLESAHRVLAKRLSLEIEMDDSKPPPFFAEVDEAEARERSLDLDVDSELWDDTTQDENGDREYSDQEYSDQGSSDQASCYDQTIPSGELSLIETESDLLCSRSHTIIHPAYTDLRDNCIRLLKILPVQFDRTIRCRLEVFSLDDKPTYTAISYTWGSQHGTHAVLVNDHSLLVPKNLWRFLNSARAVGGGLLSWLWIDMLSINQTDIAERGHQVSLMPAIFRTANLVNVWLGPAYLGSDAALIALARNVNAWKSPSQRKKLWASHGGPGIRDLCQRPYWKRLWVYQELKLARQIQLMCGTRTVAWDHFTLFLSLAETDLSAKIPRLSGSVQDSVDSPAMKMVKLNSKSVRTHLWSLIQATQHLRCADTRDKAYALLGACTEGHENIEPDYALPISTLINQILAAIYKLYPPKSLPEALERCDEIEDVLAVPRGTAFIIRGQRGSYEVPSEADIRACRLGLIIRGQRGSYEFPSEDDIRASGLGSRETRLSLWWTAFYGHVAVQRLLLETWSADYFASDCSSFDEKRLTWNATAVARHFFQTCVVGTLSLDPDLSRLYTLFDSRYNAVDGTLQQSRFDQYGKESFPLDKCFEDLVHSKAAVRTQSFKILLAPGGFLASQNDGVVDLLRAYAVHYDHCGLLKSLHEAGFVNGVNQSRFFRSAIPPETSTKQHDPFLGINAERISSYHHEIFNTPTHCVSPLNQVPGKSPMDVVRLPLLSYLASRPSTRCLPYFLRHPDCDQNVQDENGWTPLIWAARYDNSRYMKRVLDHDEPLCDVNYSDPNGWTAFEHAAAFSKTSTMSMILAAKTFDHNAVDSNGRTRLLRAVEDCDIILAKMLLGEVRCDPNIPDNEGRTPLTLAVSRCHVAPDDSEDSTTVCRMQPNAALPEHPGSTLQAVTQLRYRYLVALLRNTDVNLQDSSGRSALMVAVALGSAPMVRRLLQVEGCDPNLASPNGDTAHSLALSSGNTEIVHLLKESVNFST